MNNNDERDYEEERYNQSLMREEGREAGLVETLHNVYNLTAPTMPDCNLGGLITMRVLVGAIFGWEE